MPALLDGVFRVFLLAAPLYAVVAMGLWLLWLHLAADIPWPAATAPALWHAHEMVFGMTGAVVAGFILTAGANWTGAPHIRGRAVLPLIAAWLLGRLSLVLVAPWFPWTAVALHALFPLLLSHALWRLLHRSRDPWQLAHLGVVLGFSLLSALSPMELLGLLPMPWNVATSRLGMGLLVLLVTLIGGRLIPLFTLNWLRTQQIPFREAPPRPWLDPLVLGSTAAVVVLMGLGAQNLPAVVLALVAAGLHLGRLWRWHGWKTHAAPLVWVLHAGYLSIPLGLILLALSWSGGPLVETDALHAWTLGVSGLLVAGIMARVALGHTGRSVQHPDARLKVVYASLTLALLLRTLFPVFLPQNLPMVHLASGLFWCLGMSVFFAIYWRVLTRPVLSGN
ncbi:MAG: NnrS family protein [Magnetococcus sp. WYHC-3]